MAELTIKIIRADGSTACVSRGEGQACLVFSDEYREGDCIVLETSEAPLHLVYQVDDALGAALVYITEKNIRFEVPFGEKRICYSPKVFAGKKHYLYVRQASEAEISGDRNLAVNVMDQHGDPHCYPHASANVETRGESVFAARNAIDGVVENRSHGEWPYASWGINRDPNACLKLDFGREVEIDRIVLYTRADFPHDSWWTQATFTFSDGSSLDFPMEKSEKPHICSFAPRTVRWLTVDQLIKADDPSPFPALTQIEVYGKEAEK
ncbi:MAG: carbohydrate-binding protein [Eubacteriales bacterium]|nr:carbohydrate-binding protein [Eubacteriales bacterium]